VSSVVAVDDDHFAADARAIIPTNVPQDDEGKEGGIGGERRTIKTSVARSSEAMEVIGIARLRARVDDLPGHCWGLRPLHRGNGQPRGRAKRGLRLPLPPQRQSEDDAPKVGELLRVQENQQPRW